MTNSNILDSQLWVVIGHKKIVSTSNIMRLEGDRNYTTLHFFSGKPILLSLTLKRFEEILSANQFVRINKSTIVNRVCIKTFDRQSVVLENDQIIALSRRRSLLVCCSLKSSF